VLAFNWEVANAQPERFVFAPDGRVLLPSVQHPGIEAANNGKGYIAPAMNKLRKRARAELDKEVRDAIVGDLRESFGRKAR
jgi:secreted PhoX family phosphatase